MTPTDLFSQALRQIGVLGRGQNVSQEQLTDTQTLCNMMLGQWARKRWLIFHLLEIYTQGTGQPTYTLGPDDVQWDPTETWSQSGLSENMSTRVNRVEKAFVRQNAGSSSQVDFPLVVVRSAEDWSGVTVKLTPGGWPQQVFLDSGYPVATLHVWPAPAAIYEIHLLIANPLIRMNDLHVDINMPDEYQDAIFWNLCRRLLNSYRKPADPEIHMQAAAALNTVKNANFQVPLLRIPVGLLSAPNFNIYTGGY